MAIALTRALIDAADDTLTPTARASWVAMIRQSAFYRQSRTLFVVSVADQIDSADELVIKQLNAVMDQIEQLGLRNVDIQGDSDAAHLSIKADRQEWIAYALSILYDISVDIIGGGGGGGLQRRQSETYKSRPEW